MAFISRYGNFSLNGRLGLFRLLTLSVHTLSWGFSLALILFSASPTSLCGRNGQGGREPALFFAAASLGSSTCPVCHEWRWHICCYLLPFVFSGRIALLRELLMLPGAPGPNGARASAVAGLVIVFSVGLTWTDSVDMYQDSYRSLRESFAHQLFPQTTYDANWAICNRAVPAGKNDFNRTRKTFSC